MCNTHMMSTIGQITVPILFAALMRASRWLCVCECAYLFFPLESNHKWVICCSFYFAFLRGFSFVSLLLSDSNAGRRRSMGSICSISIFHHFHVIHNLFILIILQFFFLLLSAAALCSVGALRLLSSRFFPLVSFTTCRVCNHTICDLQAHLIGVISL